MKNSRPYRILEFVSFLTFMFGWMVILLGWVLAYYFGEALAGDSHYGILLVLAPGIISTLTGLFMMASSQVYLVLLDIRNDVRDYVSSQLNGE